MLEKVRAREAIAERQLTLIRELRQRWLMRRRAERQRLSAEFQKAGALRDRYVHLWEDCQIKLTNIQQTQKTLAERTLAIEQYRLELIGSAADTVAAERRLELLRRQQSRALVAAGRQADRERKLLADERKCLNDIYQKTEQDRSELQTQEREQVERQTRWEQDRQTAAIAEAKLQEALKSLHLQQRHYERQLEALNAELERVINSMLTERAEERPSIARAA
jgi:hypothetical protein